MSKSTKKHGKITLHSTSALTAEPKPTVEMEKQWRYLDRVAQRLFKGRHYFKLGERDKIFLHEVLNGVELDKHNQPLKRHISARENLVKAGLL